MELPDQAIFVEQVRASRDRCIGVARTILRGEEDARDAVQESILKAWEHLPCLKAEAAFSGWLVSIVVNECYQRLRRARRIVFERIEDCPAGADMTAWNGSERATPEAGLIKAESEELLHETMMAIPRNLREPLVLFYFTGLSCQEVASQLGITGTAVKMRLARARLELRRRLDSRLKCCWRRTVSKANVSHAEKCQTSSGRRYPSRTKQTGVWPPLSKS